MPKGSGKYRLLVVAQVSVKIITEDDEQSSDIVVQVCRAESFGGLLSMSARHAACGVGRGVRIDERPACGMRRWQGDEEEVQRFQRTLDLREKGMIYVKGLLES